MSENLSDANIDLLVALYQWMTLPRSRGFLEEREIPSLPESLRPVEIRALLRAAVDAGLMRTDCPPVVSNDTNLPQGWYWEFTARGVDIVKFRLTKGRDTNAFEPGTFSSFCSLLLVALADHSNKQSSNFDSFDLLALAELYSLQFSPGWVARAGEVFEGRQWVTVNRVLGFGVDGGVYVALTGPGLLEAESLRRWLINQGAVPPTFPPNETMEAEIPSAFPASTAQISDVAEVSDISMPIPAAGRFVSRADNARLFEEAEQKLESVIDAIRSDNELRVSAEDRLLLIREVKGIKSLINQTKVQFRAIHHATRESSILAWLAKEAGSGAVRTLAAAAVTALLALLFL